MLAADPKVVSPISKETLHLQPAQSWRHIIGPVEPFLEAVGHRLVQQVKAFDPDIVPYAEYALKGQGKHLRPALVALTAQALGPASEAHVTVAVIIEMVHLATLVHDDIMDEAEIRRGRLTLAANWGNDLAVLFGDCLFARALALAASFPTPEVCRAVAMSTNTVCSGEILQTQHKKDFEFSREQYFKVLEMKTGELFALSCDMSAFLSGATLDQRLAVRRFGLAFGTAYQVYDDCVDLFGTEAEAGKSLGTDLAKGKLTLPILLAWDRAEEPERERLRTMVQDWEPGYMPAAAKLLAKYDTLSASRETIEQFLNQARSAIQQLPHSPGQDSLSALTDYLGAQSLTLGAASDDGL